MTQHIKKKPKFMQSKAGDPVELERNALSAIRNVMVEDAPEPPRRARKREAVDLARAEAADAQDMARNSTPRPRVKSERLQAAAPLAAQEKMQAPKSGRLDAARASLSSYRPSRRSVMIASAVLFVLLFPWLVFWTVFLSVFVLVGVFLALGHDGFWLRVTDLVQAYTSRFPERAGPLHRKLDAFAMKWDTILDRFPDGSVDGLYMPDFNDLAQAESRYDAALDRRFADLRGGGV